MYKAKEVVIDGVTLIEEGMVKLPQEIDWEKETGNKLFYLPLKSAVASWVNLKSSQFMEEVEEEELLERAKWRQERFEQLFDKAYNENELIENILLLNRAIIGEMQSSYMYRSLARKVTRQAILALTTIKEMTDYDVSACYRVKEQGEQEGTCSEMETDVK